MTHKILIGIPTFSGYQRLEYILQSIYNRTDKDMDFIVVVCDGSGSKEHQDKVKNVISKYQGNS